MAIPAALYYPHTAITNKNLIKNSLLLWDKVEYITPARDWKHSSLESKLYNEAIEIITEPHYPSSAERKEVHNRVSKQLQDGIPPWFFLDSTKNIRNYKTYPIYPNKLEQSTWRMLEEHNLVRLDYLDKDYHGTPFFGLMLMSLLADACAGETKRKITDRSEAYEWIQKYSTIEAGGQYFIGSDASQAAPAYDRLVTISLKVLDTDDIPISALVAMRKREANSSSNDYREFRIKYLNKIDEYVDKILKPELREGDVREIERQFQKDMEQDLRELREELGLAKTKLIFSKEVGVAVTAVAGALITQFSGLTDLAPTILGGGIGVGALIRVKKEHSVAQKKVLKSNSMSWLYLTERSLPRVEPRKLII